MKKYLLHIMLISIFPSCAMASAGFSPQGDYVMPPMLSAYCDMSNDDLQNKDSVLSCLKKLETDRKETKEYIMELSNRTLQEYYKYAFATSVAAKNNVSKFMTIPEKKQAEGSKLDNPPEDTSDDIKENINEIIAVMNNSSENLNKYLQQYSYIIALNSYNIFHDNIIINPPLEETIVIGGNPFETDQEVTEDPYKDIYDENANSGEVDLTVPEEFEYLAQNCGNYEAEAMAAQTDVSVILSQCLEEKVAQSGQSYTNLYESEKQRIERLTQSYADEYDRKSKEADAEPDDQKRAELIEELNELVQKRAATLDAENRMNEAWYAKEMSTLRTIILGGNR